MAAVAGSLWVEALELKYIDDAGNVWHGTGTLVAASSAGIVGSIWIDGSDFHYIDASSNERKLQITLVGNANAGSVTGSPWISATGDAGGARVHWIDNASPTRKENYWFQNIAFSNTVFANFSNFGNTPFSQFTNGKGGFTDSPFANFPNFGNTPFANTPFVNIPVTP